MMRMMLLWVAAVLVAAVAVELVVGQQSYVNNKQLDCYNHYNTTDGYVCNGVATSCPSYLTFRSLPPYNSPTSIAYLLRSSPTEIAAANNITDVDPIPTGTPILVPVNCSCSSISNSSYYQHNTSYVLKTSSDTYFGVANNTYQGLSTCQSLMAQNPFGDRNLTIGLTLQVPLRCACPTANQTAAGVKFLLTYLVAEGDEPSTIAQRFGVDPSALLQANRLSSDDIIFFFTPLLVPLTTQPSPTQLQSSPYPPSPPPDSSTPPAGNPPSSSSKSKKWIFVGVGVGAACLILLLLFVVLLARRRSRRALPSSPTSEPPQKVSSGKMTPGSEYLNIPSSLENNTKSWTSTISSRGLHSAIGSLTVYKLEEVQRATEFFSETNRIGGSSVFRGRFEGDEAAVKVMNGDVSLSGVEINLLKRINHSNIIRLSGLCVHQAQTYLVYEYAPSGSLADRLQVEADNSTHDHQPLSWKQRVQIAHDVADALNYLHNFTHPPYIHKNLKSSNILLDANLRAKVSNFGLARALNANANANANQDSSSSSSFSTQEQGGEGGEVQFTRHVVGTHGYMAPEYIQNGVITPKLDVFAFGVVLLELLSGREALTVRGDSGSEELLLSASISGVLEGEPVRDKVSGFMDPLLKREYPLDLAFSMAQLARRCVAPQINSRPAMAEVINTLCKILSSTLDWDPSDQTDHDFTSSSTL